MLFFLMTIFTACTSETATDPEEKADGGIAAAAVVLSVDKVIGLLEQSEKNIGSVDSLASAVEEAIQAAGSAKRSDPVALLEDSLKQLLDELAVWYEIEALAGEMERQSEFIGLQVSQSGAVGLTLTEGLETSVAEADLATSEGVGILIGNLEDIAVEGESDRILLEEYIELYSIYRDILVRHESVSTAAEWIEILKARRDAL